MRIILLFLFIIGMSFALQSQAIQDYRILRVDSTDHRMTVEMDSLFLRNTQQVVDLIQVLYLDYPNENLRIVFFHDGDYSLIRGETKEKGIENFHKNFIAECSVKSGKLWYIDESGLKKRVYEFNIQK